MRLNLSLIDSCVKLVAPTHPGALAIVVGELHFNTDVIANASETISDVTLRTVTLLVVDEEKQETDEVPITPSKVRFANDVDIWKVNSIIPDSQAMLIAVGIWQRKGFASLLVVDELAARITAKKDTQPPLSVGYRKQHSECSANGIPTGRCFPS